MEQPIVEFDHVSVEGGHPYDSSLWDASFRLGSGQLMLVRLERGHVHLPLADAAEGLVEPIAGQVRFLGMNWQEKPPSACADARGRIGRIFAEVNWLSDLDVDENIMLPLLHHTTRSESEIRDEAADLARVFSLPGLPQGKSTDVRRQDLRRAACVRAFLGKPVLIILENPTAGVYPELMPALMASIRAAQARGAGVLWLTEDAEVWDDPGIRPGIRYVMSGAQLIHLSSE